MQGGYLFTGGGTGGHLFPAFAVADALRSRTPEVPILFVGSQRKREKTLVASAGFEHVALPSESPADARRRPLRFLHRTWRAVRSAKQILHERRPRVVIGCGGFASAPVVWAAARRRVPVVLLEQNVLPGRATRWLARHADRICLSFEQSKQYLSPTAPTVVTGNPVRPEVSALAERPHAESDPPTLCIFGGTLGASDLNAAVIAGLRRDPSRWAGWRIIHQTGDRDLEEVRRAYAELPLDVRVEAFLDNLPAVLAEATVVVSRAGATTLAEVACAGVPTVVVSWAKSADDHQRLNAGWYADRQAVLLAADSADDTPPHVWHEVEQLVGDRTLRQELSTRLRNLARPDATHQVIRTIDELARPEQTHT